MHSMDKSLEWILEWTALWIEMIAKRNGSGHWMSFKNCNHEDDENTRFTK